MMAGLRTYNCLINVVELKTWKKIKGKIKTIIKCILSAFVVNSFAISSTVRYLDMLNIKQLLNIYICFAVDVFLL